jgi:LysR family transcriptional regulator, glycine cleavage system transcriptional activator
MTMGKLPPLKAVRAFEAAGRLASFTRAAEELHVTHGAISHQVAQLEAWLGVRLFHRAGSQVRLTDAGRTYQSEVNAVLERLSLASMQLQQGAELRTLRINAPPTFAMRWLIPRLSVFQRRQPELRILLTTSTAAVDFAEGGYDMAIRGSADPLPRHACVPFMREIIVPVCHAGLAGKLPLGCPSDVSRHTLISYETEPVRWEQWLAHAGAAPTCPKHALHFEQMYFALQAASEGLGLVLVPLFLVIDDVLAGRLCVPFGLHAAHRRTYFATMPGSIPTAAPLGAFHEWLQEQGRDTEALIAQWAEDQGWGVQANAGAA